MPMMQLGEWLPDQQPIALPGLTQADNVYPTLTGYRSFNGRVPVTGVDALTYTCRGALSGTTQAGAHFTLVGTRVVGSGTGAEIKVIWDSGNWVDLTPAGGLLDTLTTEAKYSFAVYGDRLIAVGEGIAPLTLDTVTSTPAGSATPMVALDANASKADVCAVFKEFLILGNIVGRNNNSGIGTQRAGLHWSAIGNPTSWPDVGTDLAIDAQSDYQILDGSGGAITDIVPAGEWCAVLRERQVWRMDYVGLPNIFSFRKVDSNRGSLITGAGVAVGGVVYFPSAEGFLAFDGHSLSPIGEEKVDRYWRETQDFENKHSVHSVYNAETESIYWTVATGSDAPTTILAYRPLLQKWFQLTTLSAECIFDAVGSVIGGNLDAAPYATLKMDNAAPDSVLLQDANLDSLGVRIGERSLAAIDNSHRLMVYTDTDNTLKAEITTGDFEAPGGQRGILRWIRPIYDGRGNFSGFAAGRLAPNENPPLQPLTWMDTAGVLSSQSTENAFVQVGTITQPDPFGVGFGQGQYGYYEDRPRRVGGRYLRAKFVSVDPISKFSGFDFELRTSGSGQRAQR